MTLDYKALGKRLRKIRKAKGMTQERLADLCDTTFGHISNIENNKTKPGAELLVKIANALGVGLDVLLCDSLTAVDSLKVNVEQDAPEGLSDTEQWYLSEAMELNLELARKYGERLLEEVRRQSEEKTE